MHEMVRNRFAAFSDPLEGSVAWMYQDSLGLVTVGLGNLIDSPAAAWDTRSFGAPFVSKHDLVTEAGQGEVEAEWNAVKNNPGLKGNWQAAENLTSLRLTEAGIANLAAGKLDTFEAHLRQTAEFAALDQWPADAQLALFSMSWAQGPNFGGWPRFRAACAAQDWAAAVQDCGLSNAWLSKRNAVNRGLFRNALWAKDNGADPAELQLQIPGNRPRLALGATDADNAGQGFDTDDSVSSLQRFLTYLGYACSESGEFDGETDTAVRSFQSNENQLAAAQGGFAADGIVGALTWAALGYVVPRA
ncbi:peptidoglycan-binding protein [Kribbella antibiotica]|uniref:Peptidoglycan-binding protein n=1 Tax=Kribbella antibiotica TaxID=190195 RepID=A0A4R4ZLW6_9ACTN|nr:peptidoglycan-binding domain-containing protein [Kribbella antibiotica]TDD59555.1 peptidoglycan-binding protein [Kribbella antibiotica]